MKGYYISEVIYMTTGQRIKDARKKAGMTQKELGLKLGVTYQTIAQWENDLRNPKKETIRRIAAALSVDPVEIDDSYTVKVKVEESFEANLNAGVRVTTLKKELDRAYDNLNPAGQQEAVKRVSELTEIPRYQRQDAPTPPPDDTPTDTTQT